MTDEKDVFEKLWELCIVLLGIFFAAYTVARDMNDDKVKTNAAIDLAIIYLLVIVGVFSIGLIAYYYIYKIMKKK